jgi:hypothetical protein
MRCKTQEAQEAQKRYIKEWRNKNRQHRIETDRKWKKANSNKIKAYARKNKTGWSQKDFDEAWLRQKGRCEICGVEMEKTGSKKDSVCADHDHKTKKIRGLLCLTCNLGLGFFEKYSSECLMYLKKYETYSPLP